MPTLASMADRAGALLKQRGETVAVSESSTGGLIAAALLAVPGASAYFVGGGVIYTHRAREADMAREIWKGSLSFGLVEIPVALVAAESRRELKLSYLDRRDFAPVGYSRYNKTTEEEVPWAEIVTPSRLAETPR